MKRCSGFLRGKASASRKRISSKDEKSIANGLNWYFWICAGAAMRTRDRTTHRAFRDGRTTSHI